MKSTTLPAAGLVIAAVIALAGCATLGGLVEFEKDVRVEEVSAQAKAAAEAAVPGFELVAAEVEGRGGSTVYELRGKAGPKVYEIEVTRDGKVRSVVEGEETAEDDD